MRLLSIRSGLFRLRLSCTSQCRRCKVVQCEPSPTRSCLESPATIPAVMFSRLVSNWGQNASHMHGRQCLCCVPGHSRVPVRARKGATRKGAGGTGLRVPHARKGAGPGHSRVPVRARKGALASGALARVPVRARTHHGDLTCATNRLIDSVVQIQAPIVFLGARCGNCFAPSQIWFNEIGTNLHVFSGGRYQNMKNLTRWCQFPLFFFFNTPFFCVKPRCLGMIK